jgi:hypothetical protein
LRNLIHTCVTNIVMSSDHPTSARWLISRHFLQPEIILLPPSSPAMPSRRHKASALDSTAALASLTPEPLQLRLLLPPDLSAEATVKAAAGAGRQLLCFAKFVRAHLQIGALLALHPQACNAGRGAG